ncbi:MAG: helix-turn-helix domain-containing protein [Oscillospiraceae bacterium]|nr:helix-turn-helix domain-containing protein [Oscillospiraceae bacterium]
MQLSELKLITASNIIRLRTNAGMTQAKLGAALNYSDKTISKWERGDALPDAYVLTQMAEIFGVTVDYILSSHDGWEAPQEQNTDPERSYSAQVLMALIFVAVWTTALTVFVVLWLFDIIWWRIFVIALPVSILVLLIFACIFKQRKTLPYIIGALVLSVFIVLFFFIPHKAPWQLFLIALPSLVIVFLACNIKRRPKIK